MASLRVTSAVSTCLEKKHFADLKERITFIDININKYEYEKEFFVCSYNAVFDGIAKRM